MDAAPSVWLTGSVHPELFVIAGVAGGAWVAARRRARAGVGRGRAVAFFAGLAVLLAALNGPLHDLSERYLFSAHMVQHLLLTLAVPPLLLAGLPAFMLDGLLAPLLRHAGPAAVLRALTRPVPALLLYTVALVAWHLPGPYDTALASHGWHLVEHVTLLVTATLAWWPVLASSARLPALPYGAQILYLFAFGVPMTLVAAMITGAERVLYAFYAAAPRIGPLDPFDDQRLGGLLMWVPAGLIPLLAFTAVFFRWAAEEADDLDESERAPRPTP
ncbi:MAG: cytochrome c oxidase assembly protein [Candidatus Rokubacteria bacterium]|nr:cytochrome c oxidase assembly protein [Candidatus Rokubacteria bacterium]MBI3826774.1 cytochrome c oxidase assembly protein [Candidatus Rokubacteria bacterium]